MKGLIYLCLLLTLLGCRNEPESQNTLAEPEPKSVLVPFSQDYRWGYKTEAGEIVISPRYNMASDFSKHGNASVVDDKGWAYIDRAGRVLIRPFIFDNGPDSYQDGLARFVQEGKMGYFDPSCKVVIPAQYDFAWPFENGVAEVCEGCTSVADGEHSRIEGGTRWSIDKNGVKQTH